MTTQRFGFDRIAALAAFVVGACSIAYAIVFLGLVPDDQTSNDAEEFFTSYVNDGAGWLHTSWVLLSLAGLATTLVVVALYRELREADPAWAAWSAGVGMVGALLSAVHGVQEIAQNTKLAELWREGDAATRAALDVSNSIPSASDPRGLASFGFAGLFWLATGLLIRHAAGRDERLPRGLGYIAALGGVLLVVLFFGSAFESDVVILIPAALVSLLIGPIWWFWLGLCFWRQTGNGKRGTG